MTYGFRHFLLVQLTFTLLAFEQQSAQATQSPPPKKQIVKKISRDVLKIKRDINQSELKERQMLSQLYSLDQSVEKSAAQVKQLEDERIEFESEAIILAREINFLEDKIAHQKKQLAKRIQFLYRLKGENILRMLFSASNSSDVDRNLKYLKLITERDYELIQDFAKSRADFLDRRRELKSTVRLLLSTQKRIRSKEKTLRKSQKLQRQLLLSLKAHRKVRLSQLKGLRLKAKPLAKDISDKQILDRLALSFFEQKGKMPAPVDGEIKRSFGYLIHPNYKYKIRHKGLFFETSPQARAQAVASGKIEFAGEVPGLGSTIILDHGDNYFSVYSGLSQLLANVNDFLNKGDPLGQTGYSQFENTAGLYFEIRHFTEAIDPMDWLRETKARQSTQL